MSTVRIIHDGSIYMLQDHNGRYWMGPRLLTWEAPREPGASVPCWMTTSRESAEAQAALLECTTPQGAFLDSIDKSIEFHRTNQNDPHNVGNAVITALTEVRKAIVDSINAAP